MGTRDQLISRIEAHLNRTGMSARRFSIAVTGDHKWLARLRRGQVSLQSIERAEALLAEGKASQSNVEAA